MSEESGQDKTEEPTARKLGKAREDGQVARSTELPAAVMVIGAFVILMMSGGWLVQRLSVIFSKGFVFDRATIEKPLLLPSQFADQLIVLAGGDLQAFGPPARVLDAALIERLYQVPVEISHDQHGIPFLRTLRKTS